MKKIGFSGFGLRSDLMAQTFKRLEIPMVPAAIADPKCRELQSQLACDPYFQAAQYFETIDDMLNQQELDAVFIGTRCNLHTEQAIKTLQYGLPVFLEKPVCINSVQYQQLLAAGKSKADKVLVSFPLRFTPLIQAMKQLVDSGALGEITMVQAVNNVPYGSVYYHSWYRDPSLTGGLFLQKATHDIDTICYLLSARPATAAAFTSKLWFKGDRPPGLTCPACDEYRTCSESSYVVSKILNETPTGEECCFASDTGNEDHASLMMRTQTGIIITYSQSFIVKKTAGRRGARLVGTRASAEYDFYTGEIRVDDYHTTCVTQQTITPGTPQHFGGDDGLALAFADMLAGAPSAASLLDGLRSAACCLAARESAQTGKFIDIQYGF